jgi:hypothetical protein
MLFVSVLCVSTLMKALSRNVGHVYCKVYTFNRVLIPVTLTNLLCLINIVTFKSTFTLHCSHILQRRENIQDLLCAKTSLQAKHFHIISAV